MKIEVKLLILYLLILSCACAKDGKEYLTRHQVNPSNFRTPPDDSKPFAWWHWIGGHASKEGVTRDLEAMAEKGLGGGVILNLGTSAGDFAEKEPVYEYMSPEWFDIIQYTFQEAERLGLEIGMHNCDGWSHSGGPWVTPEEAMKQITYSKIKVNTSSSSDIKLPKPFHLLEYYRDIAVLAYPDRSSNSASMLNADFRVSSNHSNVRNLEHAVDGNSISYAEFNRVQDSPMQIEITLDFKNNFKASAIAIAGFPENQTLSNSEFLLEYSNDGKKYHKIFQSKADDPFYFREFPETKAKHYKLTIVEPVLWGSVDHVTGEQWIKFAGFELLESIKHTSISKISDFPVKTSNWIRRRDMYPPGSNMIVNAVNPSEIVDITDKLDENSYLHWDVPEGRWIILRVGYTLTGKENMPATKAGRGLECDKLNASHVESFFNKGIKRIIEANTAYAGNSFQSMLTDSYEGRGMNWTEDFSKEFENRRGYSILSYLPVLCEEVVDNVEISERFLFDFRQTIADLFKENFYDKMRELSNKHDLYYMAEAAGAQQVMPDPLTYSGVLDIPMTEFWVSHTDEFPGISLNGDVLGVVSAGQLYNKKFVAAEAFTAGSGNWRHGPYNLKRSGDAAFVLGINRLYFHSYTHQADESYPGWQMVPWGTAINRKLTWWDFSEAWFEYLSRCQFMLQQGQRVTDVLAFHGEGAGSSSYFAFQSDSERYSKQPWGGPDKLELFRELAGKGYSWTACNKDIIMNSLSVNDGWLTLPGDQKFRLMMLPDLKSISPELLLKLKELISEGAILYGPKPVSSTGLSSYPESDEQVKQLAGELWGDIDGIHITSHQVGKGTVFYGITLEDLYDRIELQPDFMYYPQNNNSPDIMFHHRISEETGYYFISNQEGTPVRLNCSFRISGKQPELWDPSTGDCFAIESYEERNGRIYTDIDFDPYGSVFIVFRSKNVRDIPVLMDLQPEEEILLDESWTVRFDTALGGPGETEFNDLLSWHLNPENSIRYYSGIATYEKDIFIPDTMFSENSIIKIDLGKVNEIAKVFINDKEAGIVWKSPYLLNISESLKSGTNRIEIKVANHWTNRLIGDELVSEEERITEPITRMHYAGKSEADLLSSGLLGPVKIIKYGY